MNREPVLTGVLVRLVIAAFAHYGLDVSAEHVMAIWAAAEVIIGLIVRARVSPVAL